MTTAKFVNGYANTEYRRWSPLLDLLQVPYGILVIEGYEPCTVSDLTYGRHMLRLYRKLNIITTKEVRAINKAMRDARLRKNDAEMIKKIREFKLPDNFVPMFNFHVCPTVNCPYTLGLHGNIKRQNGSTITPDAIRMLKEGFEICEKEVRSRLFNQMNAILLFQQMLAANLAADYKELDKRYDAIFEKMRADSVEVALRHAPPVADIKG